MDIAEAILQLMGHVLQASIKKGTQKENSLPIKQVENFLNHKDFMMEVHAFKR